MVKLTGSVRSEEERQLASVALRNKVPQSTSLPPDKGGVPQFTPTARFTSNILATGPQFSVLMYFVETYPFDPQRPEQLSGVHYTAQLATATDRTNFEQAVRTKYGPPVRYTRGVGAGWCNVGTPIAADQCVCAPDVPSLVLRGNELILGDNGIAAKERVLWNRETSGTPPF